MAGTIIKIKRSAVTVIPTSLAEGELAYSEEATSKKLYIGTNGGANIEVIGGKFFTDLLDHAAGTLTASSAIIVDASSKIDQLNVDNLTLNGNTLSSTDTNGNINLTPDGTGSVDISSLILGGGGATVTTILDEDDMSSNSATALATQQSIKAYVDAVATGLEVKESVRVLADADIDLAVAADPSPIDGVTLANGDRVLLQNQTAGAENGIYIAVTATDPTTWIRATDADTDAEVTAGMFTFIEEGTTYADSGWVLATDNPITLDTTALSFTQFSGAGSIAAGDGLDKVGNTLSVDVTDIIGTGLAEDGANNLQIATDGVNATMIELANNTGLVGRNLADTADIEMIKVNTSDDVEVPDLTINGTVNVTQILDEDNMISDSATALATQQSIKAYVDAQVGGSDTLAELTDTNITTPGDGAILIYDTGTTTWRDFVLSGDVTMDDSGAVTIANTSVENGMLVNSGVSVAGDVGGPDTVNLGETFTITGGTDLTTTIGANTVTIDIDTVSVANGGTGLTALGNAYEVLQVNAAGTALVYGDVDGGTF
jgi:hypothetical protein